MSTVSGKLDQRIWNVSDWAIVRISHRSAYIREEKQKTRKQRIRETANNHLVKKLEYAFVVVFNGVASRDTWDDMCKRYAKHYNLFHPNRKISWRRLNRPRRESAARLGI